jgi:hypothetical protein
MAKHEKEGWTTEEFTGYVYDQAQNVLDQFGDWGDRYAEPGVIRRAHFSMPGQAANLRVHEVVDPEQMWDHTSPLAYNILRDDWRGSYDLLVTVRAELGVRALKVLNHDLYIDELIATSYPSREHAADFAQRFPDHNPGEPQWPVLREEDDFPVDPLIVPRRSTLTPAQYKAGLKWHSRGEVESSSARVMFEPEKYLPHLFERSR